ncbi:hypothetical protein CQA53_09505 [Helicobacter didelphidarum]|uniref:Uncharacterized protein n=1 Tax=Helicobacter didelphidarum TaxID=2040648 RepID=A0A3D8IAC4_9HELI|nr:hypothetical protein CQA53_09505 [Helicobacter didelphidarum]
MPLPRVLYFLITTPSLLNSNIVLSSTFPPKGLCEILVKSKYQISLPSNACFLCGNPTFFQHHSLYFHFL